MKKALQPLLLAIPLLDRALIVTASLLTLFSCPLAVAAMPDSLSSRLPSNFLSPPDPIDYCGLWFSIITEDELVVFKGARRALFLSDGKEPSYAEKVALHFPELEIWKTDIAIEENRHEGMIHYLHLDNRKLSIPVEDNFFDRIVMRNGLCDHEGGDFTCAGIPKRPEQASLYLKEVARVLNKNKEDSMTVLHGGSNGMASELEKNFEEALKLFRAQSQMRLHAEIMKIGSQMIGIGMRPQAEE